MIPRPLIILVLLNGTWLLAAGKPRDLTIHFRFAQLGHDFDFEDDDSPIIITDSNCRFSFSSKFGYICNGREQGENKSKKRDRHGFNPSPERYNYFDTDILEAVARQETGNVALSPIAIKLILGMLLEGAKGTTADEIEDALRLPTEKQAARKVIKSWMKPFQENQSRQTKLSLATQIFLLNDFKINSSYAQHLENQFNGGVTNLPHDNNVVAEKINEWAKKETKGLIPEIITPGQLAGDVKAVLASALYFKGLWKYPFTTAISQCFYKTPGACTKSVYMQRTEEYRYAYLPTLDAQALEIPYMDERFSMMIILPRRSNGRFGHDFFRENLRRILGNMEHTSVSILLPRFIVNFNVDLVTALLRLGVSEAFGPGADFSAIFAASKEKVAVSNLFHSVKLVVDEKGSEGAAATFAMIVPLMADPSTVPFVADKPFYFFIWDSISNITVFAGRVTDPEVAGDNHVGLTQNHNSYFYGETFLNKQDVNRPLAAMRPGRPAAFVPKAEIPVPVSNSEVAPPETKPSTTYKPSSIVTTKPPPLFNRPSPTSPSPSPLMVRYSTQTPQSDRRPLPRPQMQSSSRRKPESIPVQFPPSGTYTSRRLDYEFMQVKQNASSTNSDIIIRFNK